jgi:hypothetical protein
MPTIPKAHEGHKQIIELGQIRSKKLRFEVFKRDAFTCQYCGAHPPAVVLQLDHIHPVAAGGTDEIDNLITSCQPCNAGKGARLLSAVPESIANKAQDLEEREEQLAGYRALMDRKRQRLEAEMWEVAETIEPGAGKNGFDRRSLISIKLFLEKLGAPTVLNAAEIAYRRIESRYRTEGRGARFKYFCGVCWKRIRDTESHKTPDGGAP